MSVTVGRLGMKMKAMSAGWGVGGGMGLFQGISELPQD